jgi:hypothetical protein
MATLKDIHKIIGTYGINDLILSIYMGDIDYIIDSLIAGDSITSCPEEDNFYPKLKAAGINDQNFPFDELEDAFKIFQLKLHNELLSN